MNCSQQLTFIEDARFESKYRFVYNLILQNNVLYD